MSLVVSDSLFENSDDYDGTQYDCNDNGRIDSDFSKTVQNANNQPRHVGHL